MLVEVRRTLICKQQNEELAAISSNTKDSEVLVATQESKCQQKQRGLSVVKSRTKNTQMLVATKAFQDVSSHTELEMLKDSEMLVATQESKCLQRHKGLSVVNSKRKNSQLLGAKRRTLRCQQQHRNRNVSSGTKDSYLLIAEQELPAVSCTPNVCIVLQI